jgi:Tc5 transposase DNA-binding domain
MLAQQIEILDWHHKSLEKNQTKTAAHWNEIYPNLCLKQPIISAWLKDEQKWQAQWAAAEDKGLTARMKQEKQTEHPEVTEMLELWVAKAMSEGVKVMGEVLRQKWIWFADLVGVPENEQLKVSKGWLTAFKKCCVLKEFKCHGEVGAVDPAEAECECACIHELIIKYRYCLKDIFNMDETGLLWA